MLNITVFFILIASIAGLIIIVHKKFSHLNELDIHGKDQEKLKKKTIIEERLTRKLRGFKDAIKNVGLMEKIGGLGGKLQTISQKVRDRKNSYIKDIKKEKVEEQEEMLKENDETSVTIEPVELDLEDAEELFNKEQYTEAEKIVIEIVKDDPKSLDAYKLLAKIYLGKKNLEHAEATLDHFIKLTKRLKVEKALDYIDVAEIKLQLKKAEAALQHAKYAVTLEPQNPKVLHFLVKVCILCNQKELAWKYYEQFKKVNEDNKKLDELLDELKEL